MNKTVQFRTSMHGKDNKKFKKDTTVCLYGAHSAAQLKDC